jgi:hypothetical protein
MRPLLVLLMATLACRSESALTEEPPGKDAAPSVAADAAAAEKDATSADATPLSAPDSQVAGGLAITGAGTVTGIDPDGLQRFEGRITVANGAATPVTLSRSPIFLLARGGYAWSVGDPVIDSGTFRGLGPILPAQSKQVLELPGWAWTAPVSHWLFRLEAKEAGVAPLNATIALERPGFAAPAPVKVDDVFLGLIEPIQVLPLLGQNNLGLPGRVVNTTGQPMVVTRFAVRVDSGAEVVLAQDISQTWRPEPISGSLPTFTYTFDMPASFTAGTLTVTADVTVAAQERHLTWTGPVERATPMSLRLPVQGQWLLSNGPGQFSLSHPHAFRPTYRYAYDLIVREDVDGTRRSFRGDPTKNESYFCYGRPVFAAAAGVVIDVSVDVPDRFGNTDNPANKEGRTGQIVLQHPGPRFTVYHYLRPGSAKVMRGQQVAAGDALAEVGNAGPGTEPHLRFAAFELDASGRPQAIPLSFTGLSSVSGAPAAGVPRGGFEYVTGP